MARARNIKPGLFKNEVLGVADPIYTLLFEGLWIMADRDGKLEDRPLRIRGEIFPYREGLDMDAMLNWLEANHFIRRYVAAGVKCILVLEFVKHQNPHKNEAPSELPDPTESASDGIGTKPEFIGTTPADSLIPDSLNLIPDSLTPAPAPPGRAEPQQPAKGYSDEFEAAWAEYPARAGGNSKADAFKAWAARRKEGVSAMDLTDGVRRYARFVELSGTEPRFVKQASTFFGPGLHFRETWDPPARASPPSRQSALEARNAATAARFLESLHVPE